MPDKMFGIRLPFSKKGKSILKAEFLDILVVIFIKVMRLFNFLFSEDTVTIAHFTVLDTDGDS